MCLLSYCDHDATPNYQGLENATINNPDGFGWAVHLVDRIITGRSMDAAVALETYEQAIKDNPGHASMFHARYTTHGATDLANCHPFRVGGSKDTVLAHNGIISAAPREKDRSDTRWFAEVELPRRGLQILDKPNKAAKLERYLGSKVIVFTTDPTLKYGIYILNEQMGEWVDGIWWSNDTYQYVWNYNKGYGWLSGHSLVERDDEVQLEEACRSCGSALSYDEAAVFGYCYSCEACLDCGQDFGLCLCYQGKLSSSTYDTYGWSDEEFERATQMALYSMKSDK